MTPLEWACLIVAAGLLAFFALLDRLLCVRRCSGLCLRCLGLGISCVRAEVAR